jgi:hypothetical protein
MMKLLGDVNKRKLMCVNRREVAGEWKTILHNVEFHDLCSSPKVNKQGKVQEGQMERTCSICGI